MKLLALTRLLQMASQALPVGGYSHSQGLESAIDAGFVDDEASACQWIADVLRYSIGRYELTILSRMSAAWACGDVAGLGVLNDEYLATRETAELRRAAVQMGFSMRALLEVLPGLPPDFVASLHTLHEPSLVCMWSGAATVWSIEPAESLLAYAWAWVENQVLVAIKSVPIGQAAGQRILLQMGLSIAEDIERRQSGVEASLSNFAPGLAILSCQHETQYSRLFRS